MQDMIKKSLKKGLLGANAHRNTREVVKNLTPAMARRKENNFHSSWELLAHTVVWQDAFLAAIEGKKINWKNIGQKKNWPSPEQMVEDSSFLELVENFKEGIDKAEKLIDSTELDKIVPLWEDLSVFETFLALVQHNSYHVGQIITVRKMLNDWPLKDWILED